MAGRKGEKIWADAVRRAVMRRLEDEEGKPKKLERLADRLVEEGLAGDVTALKEIGDRLDGKPRQIIEGTGEGGAILITIARQDAEL
jgi:hypothetical protein